MVAGGALGKTQGRADGKCDLLALHAARAIRFALVVGWEDNLLRQQGSAPSMRFLEFRRVPLQPTLNS